MIPVTSPAQPDVAKSQEDSNTALTASQNISANTHEDIVAIAGPAPAAQKPETITVTLVRGMKGLGLGYMAVKDDEEPGAVFISKLNGPPATESALKVGHRIARVKGLLTDWVDLHTVTNIDVITAFSKAGSSVTIEVEIDDPLYESFSKRANKK